jgi:hypothetical protein
VKVDRVTAEQLPIPPAFALVGSPDWGDPYIVRVLLSGLAYLSWQDREPIVIVTGEDSGADAAVRDLAALYNANPLVPVNLEVHTYRDSATMMDEEVKVVIGFTDYLSGDQRTADVMARAILNHRSVYQIRRVHA